MPELPEVQTVVDNLNRLPLAGRTITGAQVFWPKSVGLMQDTEFCRRVSGCRIRNIHRRGKYIVFGLSGDQTLLIHLRMTGRLNWTARNDARNPHEHVILQIEGAYDLRFQDTRKFGRITLTHSPQTILGKLGPEPLASGFTGKRLAEMMSPKKRQIKPLLLDQTFIAGLGNIYVDEALWHAGIHPLSRSDLIDEKAIRALHRAIRLVLNRGLKNLGTSLGKGKGNFYSTGSGPGRNAEQLKVFRRTGGDCPRCRSTIRRIVVGQRSSHICPACQPLPKTLPGAFD